MSLYPELDFNPPSTLFAKNFIKPFKAYFDPQFFGLEDLDMTRPAMFVSNHAVVGVLDVYPFAIELYLQKGIVLRALADSNHFKIPMWREFISNRIGVVEASRTNCAKIMKRKESLVVFPGGTREICKKKGEAYVLKWQDRTGFVQMALQYGYDIIPVAAVGAEEAYTIVKDADEILNETLMGKLLRSSGIAEKIFKNGELLLPFFKGLGSTVIPKPVKLYYSFGHRIETKKYKKKYKDEDIVELIKDKVELTLMHQFQELFRYRDHDDVNLVRRILTKE